MPATFHYAVGEHVAEDACQIFFSIPTQVAKNETQRVGKLSVAFDAHMTHGGFEPVDQQLGQIGRVQSQQYFSFVLTNPCCEMAVSGATGDVITAGMLRDIYRIDARIEACSRGRPMVIVDGAL